MVGREGIGGSDPGGVDEVAKFGCARGETFVDEGFSVGRAGSGESAGFVELVGFFYKGIGVA